MVQKRQISVGKRGKGEHGAVCGQSRTDAGCKTGGGKGPRT